MKRTVLYSAALAGAFLLVSAAPSGSAPAPSGAVQEKDYYGAVVALIDHEKGLIASSYLNEDTNETEKLSFRVDLNEVTVTNQLNQDLEFADVKVGDNVDLYTIVRDGKETVVEIIDYDRVLPPDA